MSCRAARSWSRVDRVADPFPFDVTCVSRAGLDPDLAALRDQFVEIKINGAAYLPWRDAVVAPNSGNADERWHSAKHSIACEKTPGRDAALLYQVGTKVKQALAVQGYPSLDALLAAEPAALPLESIKGIGAGKARQMRAVLQANRTHQPLLPPADVLPPRKRHEFFVDFEYFTDLDVDFESQWPGLAGREMIFMIGLGWNDGGGWRYEPLVADAEDGDAERLLLENFVEFLRSRCADAGAIPRKPSSIIGPRRRSGRLSARQTATRSRPITRCAPCPGATCRRFSWPVPPRCPAHSVMDSRTSLRR